MGSAKATDDVHTAIRPSKAEVVLVPQPSDDPGDPLNWSMAKKIFILALVSLSSFIGVAQALANQSGLFVQAELYHKTPVQMSYSVNGATCLIVLY